MFIIKHKNIFFALTGIILALSLASLVIFGLHASIDFTGGTLAQVTYTQVRPAPAALQASLASAGYKNYSIREAGTADYIVRTEPLSQSQRAALPQALTINGTSPATLDEITDIGPTIGAELRNKSILAIGTVLVCILLFIAFAFRKVSKPVSSWMYGSMAIVGLVHNLIVTLGFFALLGHLNGAQVDTLFVTAVLTVLGFSIHDTIVVFDRTRENLRINHDHNKREDFADTAGRSLNQTLVRSINTSLTVVITLLILYVFGPASTKDFSLTLLVGIVAGTYSSIALATPLLVAIEKRRHK